MIEQLIREGGEITIKETLIKKGQPVLYKNQKIAELLVENITADKALFSVKDSVFVVVVRRRHLLQNRCEYTVNKGGINLLEMRIDWINRTGEVITWKAN